MPAAPAHQRVTTARLTLLSITVATVLNLLLNMIGALMGRNAPGTTLLSRPQDNFGDFFSLLSTYPGGAPAIVHDRLGLHAILPLRPASLHVVSDPVVTNFHMMPLSTIIDLGLVQLLRWFDPVVMFMVLFAGIIAAVAAIAGRFAASRREALLWTAAATVSYPMLIVLARGNLFAGLTALLLVQALLSGVARRTPVLSAAMLAIACNLRPNAIMFALPLLLFYWPQRRRFSIALASVGLATLAASLAASNSLYPAYTLASFRAGLANYYTLYVLEGWGIAYGSSLFGAFRVLFGLRPALNGVALAVSLAIVSGGGVAWRRGRIDDATLVFLTAAGYCLGSTVLGDYHLLVFAAVPMAVAATSADVDAAGTRMRRIALVGSCLVLAPKNYLLIGPPQALFSLFQVVFNPLALLGLAVVVLMLAWRGDAAEPAGERPSTDARTAQALTFSV